MQGRKLVRHAWDMRWGMGLLTQHAIAGDPTRPGGCGVQTARLGEQKKNVETWLGFCCMKEDPALRGAKLMQKLHASMLSHFF